jgi:hypothetical protein
LQHLASLYALTLAGPVGAAAESAVAAVPVEQFATLSAKLTGYPPGDPTVAATLLAALATPSRSASLKQLAALVSVTPDAQLDSALRAQGLDAIANELVAAWYSGVVKNGDSEQLVLYTDALVWSAMTFSKPMGLCGGAFGYWSSPPQ